MPNDIMKRFEAACDFAVPVCPDEVNKHLVNYLARIGVNRKVKQFQSPWWREDAIWKMVVEVLGKVNSLAARDALDARDARDANLIILKTFGNFCCFRAGYYWWDLSWIASVWFGAIENKTTEALKWSESILASFCAGAWGLMWTDTVLFWLPHPKIHTENTGGSSRRLHCTNGPAYANEVENLYFLHGVMVPAYAVTHPDWITLGEIEAENNAEIKRALIEQFGWVKYLAESGAVRINERFNDRDMQNEELYEMKTGNRRFVVCDPSTGRKYSLGVPREVTSCEAAQNWLSHGLDRLAVTRT